MKNQRGFAVLEGLLILVIIVMLTGIGWYVKKASDSTNKALSSTTNYSAPKTSSNSSNKKHQFLSITEWGVKIPLSEKDAEAYYKVSPDIEQTQSDPSNITVYAGEVDDLSGPSGVSCKGEYIAYLLRLPKNDSKWQPSQNVEDGNVSPLFATRIDIGNYRYAIATKKQYGPECWATNKTGDYIVDGSTSQKFQDVVTAFAADFKNITSE